MLDLPSIDGPEAERVRRSRFIVSVVVADARDAWSRTVVRAVTSTAEALGARVGDVVDAGGDVERHRTGLVHALEIGSSAIISQPVGGVAVADVHRDVARMGSRLVLLESVPAGLLAGRDHATVVVTDEAALGRLAASLLATHVGEARTVGLLGADRDGLAGSDRERAFRIAFRELRPDIRLVSGSFGDLASAGGAAIRMAAEDDLAGLFVVEAAGARDVVRRLRAGGLHIPLVTVDLEDDLAVELAAGGMVVGLAARRAWDQGVAAATAAILALLERMVPPVVTLEPVGVTRDDVLERYREVRSEVPPSDLVDARWAAPKGW